MRRFELADGKSCKFWQIDQVDADLKISWGRIGTQGQSQLKHFPDAARAKPALDKLVSEKSSKGYVETLVSIDAPGQVSAPVLAPVIETSDCVLIAPLMPDFQSINLPEALRCEVLPSRRFPAQRGELRALDSALVEVADLLLRNCVPAPDLCDSDLWPVLEQAYALLQSTSARFDAETDPQVHAAMMALLCGLGRFVRDSTRPIQAVIDVLVAQLGLPAALERLLLAERNFGLQSSWQDRKRRIGLVANVDGRLSLVNGIPPSAVEWAFRRQFSFASEADYAYCVSRIAAALPQLHPERQAVLAMLLPDEPELSNAVAFKLAGPGAVHAVHWLQLTVTDPKARALLQKVKSDVHGVKFLDFAAMVGTLVQERGLEVLPWLLPHAAQEWVGLALTGYGVPAAIDALARAASTSKLALERFQDAIERWPQAAILALARLATAGGKEAGLASTSLSGLLRSRIDALPPVRHLLGTAAQALVERLLQQLSGPTEVAGLEDLPAVLVRPPWLQPVKQAAPALLLEPLDLAAVEAWEPGVREAALNVGAGKLKAEDELRSDLDALVEELGFRSCFQFCTERLKEAVIQSIRAQDASAFIECWMELRSACKHHDWIHHVLEPETLLLLPDSMVVASWNAISTEVDRQYSPARMLATHGLQALPGFLKALKRDTTENLSLAGNFGHVEMAPLFARAFAKLKSQRALARSWLLKFPYHAACGLVAPALGKPGEARDCAGAALRLLAENGHGELLLGVAGRYEHPGVLRALQLVLAEDPLDRFPSRRSVLPAFWNPQAWLRPVLAIGPAAGKALPDASLDTIGTMLSFPSNEGPYPGLEQLKQACTPNSLAAFAWDCFNAWMLGGSPSKEGWALTALGLFGTDDTARKLTPLVRSWPGEAAHARAVTGLDVLATIGTDVALMMLNGIAQKLKFKGLQDRARAKIEAIALARGLSTEELEDRLAPDLDLDSEGSLQLDFGPRHFTVAFNESLEPFVRDQEGVRLQDLPKPRKADDPKLAAAACERFKLLKKDARTIASQQLARLELAMCARRRWSPEAFRTLLLEHPLIRHLVQRLVWGVYRIDHAGVRQGGCLLQAFRVAEDFSLCKADDAVFDLPSGPGLCVGMPHPLDLDFATIAAFSQLFADYEILQPFPQLGRDTYALSNEEQAARNFNRWSGHSIPTGRVLGLTSKGWRRGQTADGGWIGYFSKDLIDARIIKLSLEPGLIVGVLDAHPEQQIRDITIGRINGWGEVQEPEELRELDAIAASELIRDLLSLTA